MREEKACLDEHGGEELACAALREEDEESRQRGLAQYLDDLPPVEGVRIVLREEAQRVRKQRALLVANGMPLKEEEVRKGAR